MARMFWFSMGLQNRCSTAELTGRDPRASSPAAAGQAVRPPPDRFLYSPNSPNPIASTHIAIAIIEVQSANVR